MVIDAWVVEGVQRRITTLWPHPNERQCRLVLGVEARELGWGGVTAVAAAMGVSRSTMTMTKAVADQVCAGLAGSASADRAVGR